MRSILVVRVATVLGRIRCVPSRLRYQQRWCTHLPIQKKGLSNLIGMEFNEAMSTLLVFQIGFCHLLQMMYRLLGMIWLILMITQLSPSAWVDIFPFKQRKISRFLRLDKWNHPVGLQFAWTSCLNFSPKCFFGVVFLDVAEVGMSCNPPRN